LVAALGAVLGTLGLAASAHAGDWMQVACVNPSGSAAPADGWTGATTGSSNMNFSTACGPGSPMYAIVNDVGPATVPSQVYVKYTPPGGSTLIGGSVNVNLLADGYGFDASGTAVLYEPAFAYDGNDVFFQCVAGHACQTSKPDFSGTVTLPANRGGDFWLAAGCGGVNGQVCNQGAITSVNAWAFVQLRWAHMLLSTSASPQGSGFSGSALQPGASGTAHVVFTASDPGGPGVYVVTTQLDGKTVWAGSPNSNGGKCVPVGTDSASGALMFDWQQPCPASEVVDAPVPTAGFASGSHELSVIVTDAARNSSTVLDQTINIAQPAAPAPATAPTPTTTPAAHGPKAIQARFRIKWHWAGQWTRLVKITAEHLPRRSYVHFACVGKRCPKFRGVGSRHLKRLLHKLDGHVFKAGDVLQLGVSKHGLRTERIRLKIRWGEAPRSWLLKRATRLPVRR